MKRRTLPLGIDIGTTRVRVAEAGRTSDGVRVRAVAVRSVSQGASTSGQISDPEYIAAILEDAVRELGTRERRCVASVGEPDGVLRELVLPPMTLAERERAAQFEASRSIEYPGEEATVRVHRTQLPDTWAVGVVRRASLASRLQALRLAGLTPIAVDHESCALQRAMHGYDAILDVGHRRASLHLTGAVPRTFQAFSGGADVTSAIRRDLSIDEQSAEKRKRILGTSGAGDRARAELVAEATALVRKAREIAPVTRIAVTGNASRLQFFGNDLQTATGASCETAIPDALRGTGYPDDVVQSAAVDWTLAAGLCTWKRP